MGRASPSCSCTALPLVPIPVQEMGYKNVASLKGGIINYVRVWDPPL